jgi:hypothetical protein
MPSPQMRSVLDAVNLLNSALQCDPEAVRALLEHRVPCNNALADHPTIQVGDIDGQRRVGILGLLNGIFGTDERGWGYIGAQFDDADKLTHFVNMAEPVK